MDVRSFYSLKREGFDFLLDIIERRDGTPRQIWNALSIAWDMRGLGMARYITLLPALCEHEDVSLRSRAFQLLVLWAWLIEMSPAQKVEGVDETRLHAILARALELGIREDFAFHGWRYLALYPAE
ncbi:hypothetical protein ACLEPN_31915 [Myxococcus sp. 1LA]